MVALGLYTVLAAGSHSFWPLPVTCSLFCSILHSPKKSSSRSLLFNSLPTDLNIRQCPWWNPIPWPETPWFWHDPWIVGLHARGRWETGRRLARTLMTSESLGWSRGTAAGAHSQLPVLEFGVCYQNRHGENCLLSRYLQMSSVGSRGCGSCAKKTSSLHFTLKSDRRMNYCIITVTLK